mgnify:CR=1 FL=1
MTAKKKRSVAAPRASAAASAVRPASVPGLQWIQMRNWHSFWVSFPGITGKKKTQIVIILINKLCFSIAKAISSAYTSMEDEEEDSDNTSDEDDEEEEEEAEQQLDLPEDYRGDTNPDQDWVWEPADLAEELY